MSEIRNEISKMSIRGELNLLFSMSKLIVSILDAAEDNEIACNTLQSVSQSLIDQASIISQYYYSKPMTVLAPSRVP